MRVLSRSGRSLLMSALVGLALAVIVLPLFAIANQGTIRRADLAADTTTAQTTASLFGALFQSELKAARDLRQSTTVDTFYGEMTSRRPTWPEVTAAFLVGLDGSLSFGLEMLPGGRPTAVDQLPAGMSLASALSGNSKAGPQGTTALGRALALTLRTGAETHVFSFGAGTGPLGSLYIYEPVTNLTNQVDGAVVLRVDNKILLGRFLSAPGTAFIAPPFVIDGATAGLVAHHQVQALSSVAASVLHDASLFDDMSTVTPLGMSMAGAGAADLPPNGALTYQGAPRIGGESDVAGLPGLEVLVYSNPPTLVTALGQVVTGGTGIAFAILLIAGIAILFVYQENRIAEATTTLEETKSRLLTGDIISVSQALSTAREGDLTVEVPAVESEVGLVSVLINGLLSDYSHMVAGIIRASRAVQEGARRVDDGVRSIVATASRYGDEMTSTAATVERLAGSAGVVQDATRRATELASEASQSVRQGQEAVSRIGEAVDSIKEAAIGTTREFKRLQEDSIRLTALVSSVKSNTENLDMQAANAALEARHLGTETGSAFATNIGRLARQAQETLSDAETAVRSVTGSIDAVNRRIERISEQVRLGVEEVRSVRASFEDITASNQSLAQFIDAVAESAQEQAGNAQQAAGAITAIAAAFREFDELLSSSGDEMASMRLIVANLQESVSSLKVDSALLDAVGDIPVAPVELAA